VPGGSFEVMYLLEAPAAAVQACREQLARIGDSLLVVGGDGLWQVHVHTADPGAAVEAGVVAGRPYRIRLTPLRPEVAAAPRSSGGRRVVAFVPTPALADLVAAAGGIPVGATGDAPAPREVLAALQHAQAEEVVILPGRREDRAVADAVAEALRGGGLRAAVVPTRAAVQVLAALAVADPAARFDDDVIAMTDAARATRAGALTRAGRRALTSAGVCEPGDLLGLVDDEVVAIGGDWVDLADEVLGRMLSSGAERVTLLVAEADPDHPDVSSAPAADLPARLAARVARAHPEVVVEVHRGAPVAVPLQLGVE